MPIRCSSKAVIVSNGRILVNKCFDDDGVLFYDLPGGGQHCYEKLEDSVVREVKEETGYTVRVVRFAALCEEMYEDPAVREEFPDYTHTILHIFRAELTDAPRELPTEVDLFMDECLWVTLEEFESVPRTAPECLKYKLRSILESETPLYLGSHTK